MSKRAINFASKSFTFSMHIYVLFVQVRYNKCLPFENVWKQGQNGPSVLHFNLTSSFCLRRFEIYCWKRKKKVFPPPINTICCSTAMETYVLSWKITTTRKGGQSPDNSILDDVSNSMTVCCIRVRKIGTQSRSRITRIL